jgi:hypothetical protein
MTTRTGGRLSRSDRRMGVACVWKLKSPIIEDHQLLDCFVAEEGRLLRHELEVN